MKTDIKYERASLRDVEILVEYRILFALEFSGPQPRDKTEALKETMRAYFSQAEAEGTCISVIARIEGQIAGIGSVQLRKMPGNFRNPSGNCGYIMNMFTLPQFRRRGVCTGILNRLVEEGVKAGVTAFELHATNAGEPVYVRNGFSIHPEPTYRKFI